MKMDFNLNLIQEQKLIMTQQMQLSVKILQMTVFELKEYIDKQVEENPVLDIKYDIQEQKQLRDKIDLKKFMDYLEADNYSDKNNFDYFDCREEQVSPFAFISQKKSLKDYLTEQITDLNQSDYVKQICMYIIENLDNKGYLSSTVEEICREIHAKIEDVEYCLNIVQSLEPDGIGARDLKECLKIQLKKKDVNDEDIYNIIDNYLELLAENKISELAKKLNIDNKKAQEYCDFIKKLEPKPSRGFYTGESVKYVIPDAYIRKIDGEYYIIMNDDILPKLNINPLYKNIVSNSSKDSKTSNYVKQKINSALFLIKSIQHRKSTIYKILEQILDYQKDYFEYGKDYLKPMTLKKIAKKVGVHESTVSRAIRDKYIHTDMGTIRIKDLFSTAIHSHNEDVSNLKIKNKILELINNEDKKKPLSDQKICEHLKKYNMNISRRTVAKYREELKIKSSSKRKRF